MLVSLREWIGTEDLYKYFYNSWVSLKTQFPKRYLLNTIWKVRIRVWNQMVLKKFKEQKQF